MPTKSRGPLTPKRYAPIPPSSQVHSHETNPGATFRWRVPLDDPGHREWEYVRRASGTNAAVRAVALQETQFRHSGWAAKRMSVLAALERSSVSRARVARFRNCGAGCSVRWSPSEARFGLTAHYCRDRFCIPCGAAKGAVIGNNLRELCEGKSVRFVTLTLRSFGQSLRATLNRLMNAFVRLRESFTWKSGVKGGAYFVEVKRGRGGHGWHAHLHLITEGRWVDKNDLSRAWHAASLDSYVIDIRAIPDLGPVVSYVTKYVCKPLDATVFENPDHLDECISALHGRRLCGTFGTWRGTELEAERDGPSDWCDVGPLVSILRLRAAGCPEATAVAEFLATIPVSEFPRTADPPGTPRAST